jgi:YesN/AraC family two-component response regulator
MVLRVVFAEDNYLVREGTAALLDSAEGIDLVATASDRSCLPCVDASD